VKVYQVLTYALALSLVALGLCQPDLALIEGADANGDRAVDVLDVQTVVARVLGYSAPGGCADVNSDGAIDVLDLQCILAQLTHADAPQKQVPPDSKPDARIPANHGFRVPVVLADAAGFVAREGALPASTTCLNIDPFMGTSKQTERYLFTLTPNAPPDCA